MNLNDNPIFLTQKRLVHRGGIVAAIVIAILLGASLLAGTLASLVDRNKFGFDTNEDAGRVFYAWIIGLEMLLLVLGGANRISQTLGNERKAGLWDSNRLTPLKPWQLVTGYWFGCPLREFYMTVVLAAFGLVIVLAAGLSPVLWFGTQVLVLGTALFLGLLAVLTGLVFQKPQSGAGFVVLLIFIQFPAFAASKFSVTNFLLPVHPIVRLFMAGSREGENSMSDWLGMPTIFGMTIDPVLLSLVLQSIIGVFLWRAAVRKVANPFRPPLFRSEAVALFGVLLLVQHALMWRIWDGQYPAQDGVRSDDWEALLPAVHIATLILGAVVLGANSPQPETIRLAALRGGSQNLVTIFNTSAIPLALILTAVSAAVLAVQFIHSDSWGVYWIAVGNLGAWFLIVSLLLEFSRMSYGRRAPGFIGLALFVFSVLPFILALVLSNPAIARLSLLAPGVVAMNAEADEARLGGIVLAHFGIVFLLFLAWRRRWQQLLAVRN